MFLSQLFSDPVEFLRTLLIMLPGMLLALSLHESAHGWVAHLCGDDTALRCGRVTLNPLKHFDIAGFACMLIIGFGWAKPVPVNPNNFRHYRKDDIKVALAGITANLLLFLICFILIMAIFSAAVSSLPVYEYTSVTTEQAESGLFRMQKGDDTYLWMEGSYVDASNAFRMAAGVLSYSYYNYSGSAPDLFNSLITPAFGSVVSIIYEMLVYCMVINLSLAVFNLIPIPPLDGYHVLNDLVLKQDLFAQMKTARICGGILMLLIVIGNYNANLDIISIVIRAVRSFFCGSFASLFRLIAQALGIF